MSDQLFCGELSAYDPESGAPSHWCRSIIDPALVADQRVLSNLLEAESRYLPSGSYFQCVQQEIRPSMRKVLAYWMAEVCEENRCQDDVLPLAMNLLDRFLSVANVRKQHLQLLGAVCLFISSKLREAVPLCVRLLSRSTDYSSTVAEILDWEVLVLLKLNWEVSAITSYDFLNPLLYRLPLSAYLSQSRVDEVRRIAQTFIVMCATDYKFCSCPASMIASACIVAAANTLISPSQRSHAVGHLLAELRSLAAVEIDLLRTWWKQIDDLVVELASEQAPTPSSDQKQSSNAPTPTDLLDVEF